MSNLISVTCGVLWVAIWTLGQLLNGCSASATFQVDVADLFKPQKRHLPLSSIIDYRQTNVETVKNVHFMYFNR